MRRNQTYAALLLCVAVSCSTFQSQKVRQIAFTIEETAQQTTILVDNDRITADQAQAILSALKVARAQLGRYWEAVRTGAPRSTTNVILDALDDALDEAVRLLAAQEKK